MGNLAIKGWNEIKAVMKKAIETRDVSLCTEIYKIAERRKIYLRRVYYTLVSSYYKECIEKVAQILGDESLCEEIGYSTGIAECRKKVFFENTPLCREFSGEERLECFEEIAVKTNDTNLCIKIGGKKQESA